MENYQKIMEEEIESIGGNRPRLLLHSCCAPCSSSVLEYLDKFFNITVFYYNPNISPRSEFESRLNELKKFLHILPREEEDDEIELVEGEYDHDRFLEIEVPYADMKEGTERCFTCYEMRLEEAAKYASEKGFDYFTTTLSVSPHKNAEKLNEAGKRLASKYNVKYLFSDFKKKDGFKRSVELSQKYGFYRQNYCGCEVSKKAAEERIAAGNARETEGIG